MVCGDLLHFNHKWCAAGPREMVTSVNVALYVKKVLMATNPEPPACLPDSHSARAWLDGLAEIVCPADLDAETLIDLIARARHDDNLRAHAADLARAVTEHRFGDGVFIRGLIEIGNYCGSNCLYCGIRAGNTEARRYRLSRDTVLDCCGFGYERGFRTFVLQGGEDPLYDHGVLTDIIEAIRNDFPDVAITLSVGERERAVYAEWRRAGADRYLLRHETANPAHFARLHPPGQTWENRKRCLHDLQDLGYQTGGGFMVGSPYQTDADLAADILFLRDLDPAMIGIGPFIPHHNSPFRDFPPGSVEDTLFLLSLLRLLFPRVLLPATTALGTLAPDGRERGLLAGANVVMPNLTPADTRGAYELYDNKLSDGAEAGENLLALKKRLHGIGRQVVVSRGDYV